MLRGFDCHTPRLGASSNDRIVQELSQDCEQIRMSNFNSTHERSAEAVDDLILVLNRLSRACSDGHGQFIALFSRQSEGESLICGCHRAHASHMPSVSYLALSCSAFSLTLYTISY